MQFSANKGSYGATVPTPDRDSLQQSLVRGTLTKYNPWAAYLCAVASAWIYAEPKTMADMLARQGLGPSRNTALRLSVSNDALFIDASADLVFSSDGTLAVLCFRGTELRNVVNWLTDITTSVSTMPGHPGLVHGGIYHNLLAIWDEIVACLQLILPTQATSSFPAGEEPVPPSVVELADMAAFTAKLGTPTVQGSVDPIAYLDLPKQLKALYITGHSLGGAMAALAAVRLLTEPAYANLQRVVRGVYTFGQPLIVNREFAASLDDTVKRAVHRHVYSRDIVPRLPSSSMAELVHFGPERTARSVVGPHGELFPTPWGAEREQFTTQLSTFIVTNVIGVSDYVVQQFRALRHVQLPYSWENHIPRHYVQSSLLPGQISEYTPLPLPF